MSRDWILRALASLPVCFWPIFLWDVVWFGRWLDGLPGDVEALVTYSVSKRGRIVILSHYEADRKSPDHWTTHAPRRPWLARDPDAVAAMIAAFQRPDWYRTVTGLFPDCGWTAPGPCFLDSG